MTAAVAKKLSHPTFDFAGRMEIVTADEIGLTRERTAEGYLLCKDVAVTRTGVLPYGAGQIPVTPDDRGIIMVERPLEVVTYPESMNSCNGKPVTDGHIAMVDVKTHGKLAKGVMLNARAGDGLHAGACVVDLLIYDQQMIDDIGAGKVEVSLGYDGAYEEIAPGRARLTGYLANHVALVEHGRCGPSCAIGDEDTMTTSALKNGTSLTSKIWAMFQTKDEAGLARALGVDKDGNPVGATKDEEMQTPAGGPAIHLHINSGTGETKTQETKTGDDETQAAQPDGITAAIGQITEVLTKIDERLTKLEAGASSASTADEDKEGDDDKEEKEKETKDEDKSDDDDDDKKDKYKSGETKDSANMKVEFTAMLSDAEAIMPGFKLPTFDGKAKRKTTYDAMCGFRRDVLKSAFADKARKPMVAKFLIGGKTLDSLPCDAVNIAFTAVAGEARTANTRDSIQTKGVQFNKAQFDRGSDIDKRNKDFWSKQKPRQ